MNELQVIGFILMNGFVLIVANKEDNILIEAWSLISLLLLGIMLCFF